MSSLLGTLCMIFLFFVTGQIIEGIKRLLMFIVNSCLRILDLFGCHIRDNEYTLRVSRDFKNTFKDIRIVKKSKQNTKLKPSINLFALIMFLVTTTLIIIDLDVVSGGVITNWLYESTFFNKFVASRQSIEVTYVATMFSAMSFAASKLMSQWKETRDIRKTKRQIKARNKALAMSTSKELLDAAKLRDAERYEQLKYKQED